MREVAELWVTRKGNDALSVAISPAKNDFARRYAAAIEADDKLTLNTLDLFRKDVSTYVRLYDFMSQIVDYGDPYMEILSIFLRLLEKVIADSSWGRRSTSPTWSWSGSSTTKASRSTSR